MSFLQVVHLGKSDDVYYRPPAGVESAGPLQPTDAAVFRPHAQGHPASRQPRWQPSPWLGFGLEGKYDGWAHLEPPEELHYARRVGCGRSRWFELLSCWDQVCITGNKHRTPH